MSTLYKFGRVYKFNYNLSEYIFSEHVYKSFGNISEVRLLDNVDVVLHSKTGYKDVDNYLHMYGHIGYHDSGNDFVTAFIDIDFEYCDQFRKLKGEDYTRYLSAKRLFLPELRNGRIDKIIGN